MLQDPNAKNQDSDGLSFTLWGKLVALPGHQDVSNFLMLALQSGTMLPSLLLLSFSIWSEFHAVSISQCRAGIDDSNTGIFGPGLSSLTLRAVMFFASGTSEWPALRHGALFIQM
jgi:hypothetical protein